jgi:hypothetical protein
LQNYVHVAGRQDFTEAADLIARFGDFAASEAASRARASRDLGNVVHFCRWRGIERMIEMLAQDTPAGAVH